MEHKPHHASTPSGKTFDVSWPGDTKGGGARPNIAVKKRAEFLADVLGEHADGRPPMTLPEIKKKYRQQFASERTLFKWLKWARGLAPVEGSDSAAE